MKKILLALATMGIFTMGADASNDIFPVSTIDGKMIRFEDTDGGVATSPYQGKIVFVEFWGTWCGPCLLSIPHHVELQEEYKDKLRIIAFETTPKVTKEELQKYVADPSTHIDMKRVSFYLNKKAKSQAAKDSLKKPIEILEAFKASKKKIPYDMVAYADGKGFVDYIAKRAQWAGFIPFLIVLDGNGNAVDMVPGMPSKEKLEEIIQRLIKDKKYGIK